MLRHPSKPTSIYDLAQYIGYAYSHAMIPVNITNAFKACEIFPYDRNIFSDIDFLPSDVTNRLLPEVLSKDEINVEEEPSSVHNNEINPDLLL